MTKNVICKKCNNLVNGWCEKVIDSPDPDMQIDCRYFCEKTNADRIRAMSDEEIAKIFTSAVADGCPPKIDWDCAKDEYGWDACDACWCKWLQQPAEE